MLATAFFCAFYLVLLLPVETSTVHLDSPEMSLDIAILTQVCIMVVSGMQSAVLHVASRRHFLSPSAVPSKEIRKGEPAFKVFDEDLERETF